ncbi:MAG: type I secretion system permease/ATPase [Caulobacteraceae bacterium]
MALPPQAARPIAEPTKILLDPKPVRRLVTAAVVVSMITNMLALVQPVFMLHVYDYVLSSQSRSTLFWLTLIALFLIGVLAVLDFLRGRLMSEVGMEIDRQVRERAFLGAYSRSVSQRQFGRSSFSGDLDTLRAFLTGPGATALMDLPWTPIFIIALFTLSWLLGSIAVLFSALIAVVVFANQGSTRKLARQGLAQNTKAQRMAEDIFQAADAVEAMGFGKRALARWAGASRDAAETNNLAAARSGVSTAMVKGLRIALQILSLAIAAWLVLDGKVTPGAMFASSIIGARALGPIDQAVSAWRTISAARLSWANLSELVREHDATNRDRTLLPAPTGEIKLENVAVATADRSAVLIQGVTMEIPAGAFVGVVGASGSGKTTMARAIAGAVPLAGGAVRFDGADSRQWDREHLGKHIGYLPQSVNLMHATVAETIRRFGPADDAGVVAAAKMAGAHDMITRLPGGYDTDVGDAGGRLSGGQRARIGMARAFYGDPQILILDEPFASLDAEGEQTTWNALREARKRKRTLIMVSHRPSELTGFDFVAVMAGGRLAKFGPVSEILPAITKPPAIAS